jgi:hypothetical protein
MCKPGMQRVMTVWQTSYVFRCIERVGHKQAARGNDRYRCLFESSGKWRHGLSYKPNLLTWVVRLATFLDIDVREVVKEDPRQAF